MLHRTVICVLLVAGNLLAVVLLACGQAAQVVAEPAAPAEPTREPELPAAPPPPTGSRVVSAAPMIPFNIGLLSLETTILSSNLIVKARLNSITSDALTDKNGKYRGIVKFNLTVSEHLRGSSPTKIVGVWVDGWPYDTSAEAINKANTLIAGRDTQWDDREAVIFLKTSSAVTARYLRESNHYLLAWGEWDRTGKDDFHTLYSNGRRTWLPSSSASSGGSGARSPGDSQEFLLSLPQSTLRSASAGTGATAGRSTGTDTSNGQSTTIGTLNDTIRKLMAEYNGGDGSDAYKKCVGQKYQHLSKARNWPALYGNPYTALGVEEHSLAAGQAAGTVVSELVIYDPYAVLTNPLPPLDSMWVSGTDAAHFEAFNPTVYGVDLDNDGTLDKLKSETGVRTTRPLPAGDYRITVHEGWPHHAICGFVAQNDWTVTVTASAGAFKHETLFDPVDIGDAIGADGTNGVLKPATFTDANGAAATIERISYESGTVKMRIDPHTGLAGQKLDFIALDGSVSLSLQVNEATVDAANHTLSWPVSAQPWQDGDKLMLRIAEVVP